MTLRIFNMENNMHDTYLIKNALSETFSEEFEFDYAPSIQESFEKIDAVEQDLIILDLGLNDSAGYATIKRVKDKYPKTPIVVYSGDSHEEAVTSILNAGADVYINKNDSHISELVGVIELFKSIKAAK